MSIEPTRETLTGRRPGAPRRRWKRILRGSAVALAILFVLAQIVPYGRAHRNPATTASPSWDSPATLASAKASCFDCHSNETKWPWYTNVAPASWLVQKDVDEGRATLNFSEWDRPQEEAHEAAEVVREGEMPPLKYLLLHPGAKLSDTQREALARGLEATFQRSPPIGGERGDDED